MGSRTDMSALTGPTKMPAIFEAIWRNQFVSPEQIHTDSPLVIGRALEAPPIDLESLRQVHTNRYLKALFTGDPFHLATSQGLAIWNEDVARGWLLNVGGFYEAAQTALQKNTITANLGHGYHHATVNRSSAFCTINGLVVAKRLIREGKANRVMIIDLDHHEGNGTAECIIGENSIWNVSIYGVYMGGPPSTGNNHIFQVQHGEFEIGEKRDVHYLAVVAEILPELIRRQNPDLILYQAGMDPYDGAGISSKALAIRDAYVFALSRSMDKPLTWVLAGGYADIETLVDLHTGTVRMANEVLATVKPKDKIEHHGKKPYRWFVERGVIQFPDWKSLTRGRRRIYQPSSLTETEIREFVASRQWLFQEERLLDDEIYSAYKKLFAPKPLP
jgi:acetoin utilization deacetylase AcuC-like enzyme